jgi:hypothetical protein
MGPVSLALLLVHISSQQMMYGSPYLTLLISPYPDVAVSHYQPGNLAPPARAHTTCLGRVEREALAVQNVADCRHDRHQTARAGARESKVISVSCVDYVTPADEAGDSAIEPDTDDV